MARRYGRNQKRKAKAEIARLAAECRTQEWLRKSAEFALQSVKEDALREYATKHGMIEQAMSRISYELGRALAPELIEPAKQLLASRGSGAGFDVSLAMDYKTMTYSIIEGKIPSLHYRIHAL